MTDFIADVLSGYIWRYLTARYHDIRALGSGSNQPSLSAELIRADPVQLPVQRQLVAKVDAHHQTIAAMKADVQQKTEQAKTEVEAMILGERRGSE